MEKGYNVKIENTTKHYSKVVIDEDGQVVMVLPDKLMKALKLVANEVLEWNVGAEEITIKRIKFIDNTSNK